MNVLLIGGAGSLLDKTIIKLKKEGHRVYLLTGEKFHKSQTEKVFEKYYFDYDSENLTEIFDSVDPDVTLFMGAYDTNFNWKDEQKEAIRFTSAVMNILVAYSSIKKGRFIFLSSEEVFSEESKKNIDETVKTSATTFRGMALAQSEVMCENYRQNLDLDLVILRVDHLYSMPRKATDVRGIALEMCLKGLKNGYITATTGKEVSMVYETDAVEFFYKAMTAKKTGQNIYHISSGAVIMEYELASMIAEHMDNVNVVLKDGDNRRVVLDNKRFDKEFGIVIFAKYKETIKKVVDHMVGHRAVFVEGTDTIMSKFQKFLANRGYVIRSLVPFLENLICFIPFFMLNNRAVGSDYFSNLDFYLLYVLLFAIVYGQQQAIFSATLAVAGYCFRQMYDRSSFSVMLDYNTYVWITQLFILGLVVGYMRDQIRIIRQENEEEQEHLKEQLNDILEINNSNMRVKDVLEQQVIEQRDSVGKIYSMTSALDQVMPDEVLFSAIGLIGEIMDSKDVAIYSVHNEEYARLFSASSKKAKSLGNSIRYKELGEVYETIAQKKVYINRSLDEEFPIMANAIFEKEKMELIIVVWGMPWERVTLGQANLLTVVSYLIQNAVLRADRYMAALEDQRYIENSVILDEEAFGSIVNAYKKAEDEDLADSTLLKIAYRNATMEQVSAKLSTFLRHSDYLGVLYTDKLHLLLANTDERDAQNVINRLKDFEVDAEIVDLEVKENHEEDSEEEL